MAKKLFRSTTDKMVGGVSGGLAEYFDIDATIIRVIFIVTVLVGGGGIIAYIILWIIVPEKPFSINSPDESTETSQDSQSTGESSSDENQPGDSKTTFNAFIKAQEEQKKSKSMWGGIILILLGGLFLLDNFIPRFDFGDFWPIVLIGVGIGLLINAKN